MENNVREQGLSLILLWKLLWKNVFSVLYFMIVGVVLSVVYTQFIAEPSYSATGNIENIGAVSATLMQTVPTIVNEDATIDGVLTKIGVAEENKASKKSEIRANLSVTTYNTTTLKVSVSYEGAFQDEVVLILNSVIDVTVERFIERNPTAIDKIQKQSNAITASASGLSNTIIYAAFVLGSSFFGVVISVGGDLLKRKVLFDTDILEYNIPSHVIDLARKKEDKTPILESKEFNDGLLVLQDRIEGSARRSQAKVIGVVNLGYDTYNNLSGILAEKFSGVGLKTVIVDLDFETPVVHELYGIERKSSVTNILRGGDTKPIRVKNNVYVLPTETYTYPAKLLKDSDLAKLLKRLQGEFDYVLVNVPRTDYYASILFNFKLINILVINVSFEGTAIKDIDNYINNVEMKNRDNLFLNAINSGVKKDYFAFLKKKKGVAEVNSQ